jgi:pimeloyl-ACP methyl ester carboxylesterase
MMRAFLLGAALSAMSLSACQTSAVGQATTQATPTVALEDKYASGADGVKIHYVASGKGPLVVLIHGFPDYSGSWAKLTPKLNDAYRVVALDTRGYNLSGQPVGVENYKMPKLVEDVQAVIKAEGASKATIIGHDWGAAISWEYAFAHPETLERLVILSVPHPDSFAVQLATNKRQQQNSAYARNFQKPGSENNLTAEGLAGWVKDPAMKAGYVEAFKRSSFAAMMNYYRANYPDGANAPAPNAAVEDHPKINAPVLVIHGMKDTALLSAGHNNTWEHIGKDTTMLMIPDAAHFVQHDAEAQVNAGIRSWLDLYPVQ